MKRITFILGALALSSICCMACFPDDYLDETKKNQPIEKPEPKPEPDPDPTPDPDPNPNPNPGGDLSYDNLAAYDVLKSYVNRTVSPDFKLGAAVTVSNFLKKTQEYKMATENFDEMTAGNAMKQASILRNDGSMDFTQVRNFLNAAEQAGMTVYGHTLAWHAQQSNAYLNGLIKGKKVEVPGGTGEAVLWDDFWDGFFTEESLIAAYKNKLYPDN